MTMKSMKMQKSTRTVGTQTEDLSFWTSFGFLFFSCCGTSLFVEPGVFIEEPEKKDANNSGDSNSTNNGKATTKQPTEREPLLSSKK